MPRPPQIGGHLAIVDRLVHGDVEQLTAGGRIVERQHFRVAYQRRGDDTRETVQAIYRAARVQYGAENVRYGGSPKRGEPLGFPVRDRDGRSVSSLSLSEVLNDMPASRNEYVFVAPELRPEAARWIDSHRDEIIAEAQREPDNEQEVTP